VPLVTLVEEIKEFKYDIRNGIQHKNVRMSSSIEIHIFLQMLCYILRFPLQILRNCKRVIYLDPNNNINANEP
jgi:hypothetical protein